MDVVCSICHGVMQDASFIDCGHTFCQSCITSAVRNDARCPMCRADFYDIRPALLVRQWIKKLPVKCTDCDWTGPQANLKAHCLKCPNKLRPCDRCLQEVKGMDMERHQKESCPCQDAICGYCKLVQRRNELSFHMQYECKVMKTTCRKCHSEVNMATHQCPRVIRACPYSYLGCTKRLGHKKMQQHLQDKADWHASLVKDHKGVHQRVGILKSCLSRDDYIQAARSGQYYILEGLYAMVPDERPDAESILAKLPYDRYKEWVPTLMKMYPAKDIMQFYLGNIESEAVQRIIKMIVLEYGEVCIPEERFRDIPDYQRIITLQRDLLAEKKDENSCLPGDRYLGMCQKRERDVETDMDEVDSDEDEPPLQRRKIAEGVPGASGNGSGQAAPSSQEQAQASSAQQEEQEDLFQTVFGQQDAYPGENDTMGNLSLAETIV